MVDLKGVARQIELLAIDWRDHAIFPTRMRIEETNEELELPSQDIISFGRLRVHEGALANDVVLIPQDQAQALRISRWHFELRRFPDGFRLRPVSDGATEVDGEVIEKGREVLVKPGTKIRVAKVLTVSVASTLSAVLSTAPTHWSMLWYRYCASRPTKLTLCSSNASASYLSKSASLQLWRPRWSRR